MFNLLLRFSFAIFMLPQSNWVSAQTTNPAREFLDNEKILFSTEGHPKAKGVYLTIYYPKSWSAAEGNRPNIVQKFTSESGKGFEMMMIITKDIPLPEGTSLSDNDLKELFSPSELRGMIPDGANFISAKSTKVDGNPAGILEFSMLGESAGITIPIQTLAFNFVSDGKFVQIQFSVSNPGGSGQELAARMESYKPLFMLMANSVVLPNKWKTAERQVNDYDASKNQLIENSEGSSSTLFISVLIGLISTWAIGLTPPILTRYAFVRRPLDRKTASWLAAGFSVFFWLTFFLINSALGEKPGNGAVWVIMFFVSRWIMSRGLKDNSEIIAS